MKTRKIIKWGIVFAVVLTGIVAWMVATDEGLSRHVSAWERGYGNGGHE